MQDGRQCAAVCAQDLDLNRKLAQALMVVECCSRVVARKEDAVEIVSTELLSAGRSLREILGELDGSSRQYS